jgi:hypothetical protein
VSRSDVTYLFYVTLHSEVCFNLRSLFHAESKEAKTQSFFITRKHFPVGVCYVTVTDSLPNGHGFKPGRGEGFLTAIKIRSTTSFAR